MTANSLRIAANTVSAVINKVSTLTHRIVGDGRGVISNFSETSPSISLYYDPSIIKNF